MTGHTNGETLDFARCWKSGTVHVLERSDCAPHWVGRAGEKSGVAVGPIVAVAANRLNSGVRMIRLSPSYQHWAEGQAVAVVGLVTAGRYDVTVAYSSCPEAAETLTLPDEWARPGYFALRVRGTSMQEAGIREGDYVLVRPQHSADNGDLVIAGLVDADAPEGYVTLKQYFREEDHIRLQPAHAAMAPIHLYPRHGQDPIEIQGKVMAVVRIENEDWE